MTIAFSCENCGKDFRTDASLAGKKCKCRQCGHVFLIPAARPTSASASASPSPSRAARNIGAEESPGRPRPASSRPAAPRHPAYDDELADPYGLDDAPVAYAKPPVDDEILPPRAPRPGGSRPKKKSTSDSLTFFSGLPGSVYLVMFAVFVALGAWTAVSPSTGSVMLIGAVFLCAIALSFYSSIGLLIHAFSEGVGQGLMCLFIPFYSFIFLFGRWDRLKGLFFAMIAGTALCVVPAVLLPALVVARNAAQQNRQDLFAQAGVGDPGGAPAPGAANGADFEVSVKDMVETLESLADLAATVTNEDSARAASSRFHELHSHLLVTLQQVNNAKTFTNNDGATFANLSGAFENIALGVKYNARAKDAGERFQRDMNRIKAMPNVVAALAGGSAQPGSFGQPGGNPAFGPNPNSGAGFAQGRRAGPLFGNGPPGASAFNPPTPGNPEETVTLQVTGLSDPETSAFFGEKLQDLKAGNMRGSGGGGRMTYVFWPVSDVKDFADRITWAKVTRVDGRTVHVAMTPLRRDQRRPADTDFVGQVLFDLKSPALQKRKDALHRLQNAPADPSRREEVAKAVESMLKDPDGFGRADAAKTLAVWGGSENTPALVAALRDPQFNVRWAVLDTIKALKDPAAAEGVSAFLPTEKGRAAEALQAMGPAAEPFVIKYLTHDDVFVRMEAAKVLKVIGTEACVPALQELIRRQNNFGLDVGAASEALDAQGAPHVSAPARKKSGTGSRTPRR